MTKTRIQSALLKRIAALAIVFTSVSAHAAPTPEQKCEAGKNNVAGKLAACLAKAEKSWVIGGDATKYAEAQLKCHGKAAAAWSKLETAAIDAGTACPSNGDQEAAAGFIEACMQSVALAAGGGPLGLDPVACAADLATCEADLALCDGDLLATEADVAQCEADLVVCEGNQAACEGDLGDCQTDLAACLASDGGALPSTNQTVCYDAANMPVSCAGTGQDGAFQMGVTRSFNDNLDGTVTDLSTGLMWETHDDGGGIHDADNSYTWANAFTKVATLNSTAFAGHNDWRLPNIVELESLKNFAAANPATYTAFNSSCDLGCVACSCTRFASDSQKYWSSTYTPGNAAVAMHVHFNTGGTSSSFKTDTRLVRAVRGGS